ncbi:MAG: TIM-barrel domain-containing protein [Ethanoligenens sp.]
MIHKYKFGTPLETDAVIQTLSASPTAELPYLSVQETPLSFTYTMGADDIVYGLGENVRGINKRGWLYESRCSDDPHHSEEKHALYGAHNFLIVDGQEQFGLFFDDPGVITFDVGYSAHDTLTIASENGDLNLYVIQEKDLKGIVREFRQLIGRSYIAPKWAFGYGSSRWSYMNEDEVREVVRQHRDAGIPLDSVYLDIDYMERYKDFTVNQETFPHLGAFAAEMKAQNIHLVPIIDAGVKVEKGYDLYEEGVRNGYFCTEADGEPFVAAVWPGQALFPDVLNPKVRTWFGMQYKKLLDQGIEGFWNDMNEPAIFYSKKRLKAAIDEINTLQGRELGITDYNKLMSLVNGLPNSEEDYKSFYHNMPGQRVRHDKVRNLFGYNMTRAGSEAFDTLEPEKRILLFSRSSYIGMHRYGGIWTGDNRSWWSHLLLNIRMMPSLNMVGILYTGADLGGFGSNTTEDLLLRWLAFGLFTPLMRNHTELGSRRQEAYCFENQEAFRNIIGIRYGLLPYLYSEYMKAALRDELYFRPLAFDYPNDDFAAHVEDQLLLGDGLMLAPVYEQNAKGRYVYLPERMLLVRMHSLSDRTTEIIEKGCHYIDVALDELVFFLRPDHLLPLSAGGQCVADVDFHHLELLSFAEHGAAYEYYDDDGLNKNYMDPAHWNRISVDKNKAVHVEGTTGLQVQLATN